MTQRNKMGAGGSASAYIDEDYGDYGDYDDEYDQEAADLKAALKASQKEAKKNKKKKNEIDELDVEYIFGRFEGAFTMAQIRGTLDGYCDVETENRK